MNKFIYFSLSVKINWLAKFYFPTVKNRIDFAHDTFFDIDKNKLHIVIFDPVKNWIRLTKTWKNLNSFLARDLGLNLLSVLFFWWCARLITSLISKQKLFDTLSFNNNFAVWQAVITLTYVSIRIGFDCLLARSAQALALTFYFVSESSELIIYKFTFFFHMILLKSSYRSGFDHIPSQDGWFTSQKRCDEFLFRKFIRFPDFPDFLHMFIFYKQFVI